MSNENGGGLKSNGLSTIIPIVIFLFTVVDLAFLVEIPSFGVNVLRIAVLFVILTYIGSRFRHSKGLNKGSILGRDFALYRDARNIDLVLSASHSRREAGGVNPDQKCNKRGRELRQYAQEVRIYLAKPGISDDHPLYKMPDIFIELERYYGRVFGSEWRLIVHAAKTVISIIKEDNHPYTNGPDPELIGRIVGQLEGYAEQLRSRQEGCDTDALTALSCQLNRLPKSRVVS